MTTLYAGTRVWSTEHGRHFEVGEALEVTQIDPEALKGLLDNHILYTPKEWKKVCEDLVTELGDAAPVYAVRYLDSLPVPKALVPAPKPKPSKDESKE